MLLEKIKFDPKAPILARFAGSSLIGAVNFSISNLIQQHLRRQRYGAPTEGIDGANDEAATAEAAAEEARNRHEQGFVLADDPLVVAAQLKLVRDSVQSNLLENAARKPLLSDPSKTMPDPFHIGLAFGESLDFQTKMQPKISDAQVKAEAKVLGCTEEEIRTAVMNRHVRQLNFLKDNRADILGIYDGLTVTGADGHALDIDDADAVFAKLPAIVRLRLAAAVDKGLYRARMREVERHMSRQPDAIGNIGLIDGLRRDVLAEVSRWMANADFKKDLDEAISRGGNLPQWSPAPQPMEKAA